MKRYNEVNDFSFCVIQNFCHFSPNIKIWMTTILQFMLPGHEEKLSLPEAPLSWTVEEIRHKLLSILKDKKSNPPESSSQIRLIYSGRVLRGSNHLENIINKEIQPPYTFQILIGPPGSNPEPVAQLFNDTSEQKDGCCLLI